MLLLALIKNPVDSVVEIILNANGTVIILMFKSVFCLQIVQL